MGGGTLAALPAATGATTTTTVYIANPSNVKNTADDVKDKPKVLDATTTAAIVKEYFKDIPIMANIAFCESRDRQTDTDGNIFRGTVNTHDIGVMQINTDYHADEAAKLGINLYTIEGNMAYARLLFEREGTRPWKSSSPCWIPRSNLIAIK